LIQYRDGFSVTLFGESFRLNGSLDRQLQFAGLRGSLIHASSVRIFSPESEKSVFAKLAAPGKNPANHQNPFEQAMPEGATNASVAAF
jgi:hypothetical protein